MKILFKWGLKLLILENEIGIQAFDWILILFFNQQFKASLQIMLLKDNMNILF